MRIFAGGVRLAENHPIDLMYLQSLLRVLLVTPGRPVGNRDGVLHRSVQAATQWKHHTDSLTKSLSRSAC